MTVMLFLVLLMFNSVRNCEVWCRKKNNSLAVLAGTDEPTPVGLYCGDDVFVGFLYGNLSGSIFLQFHTDINVRRMGFMFQYKASSK